MMKRFIEGKLVLFNLNKIHLVEILKILVKLMMKYQDYCTFDKLGFRLSV